MAFDPAPGALDAVIDPDWLAGMLGTRWPGVSVRGVEVVETLATQATKVRLKLDLDGAAADTPREICIKGVLTDTGAHPSASIVETLFYRHLADGLEVRRPPWVYASLDVANARGVLVMRDVIAAGGRFLGALQPFTPDEAAEGLDQLASLHVAGWQGEALYETAWIPRFLDRMTVKPIMPQARLQQLLDGPRGAPLAPSVRSAERLQRGLERLAEEVRDAPNCLVHGDAHAGNIYRTEAGVGLVDWQILQKGDWAQDVAYHLAAVLSPHDRRAHERALLDHYRETLKAAGGPDLAANDAWRRYRAAMVYGYYLWGITQKVEPEITEEFVRRLGAAVDELESFELLGV